MKTYMTTSPIGGKLICSAHFTHEIHLVAGTEKEVEDLINRMSWNGNKH